MSHVHFNDVHIRNFLAIGEARIWLERRGLLLIRGENLDDPSATSNGSGKSSVADAICWALFGVTARGVTADGVINRKFGKDTMVRLSIQVGEDEYVIARHRADSKLKNRLFVGKNGKDITFGTDKLTQGLIESIIGCTKEVFMASIYAGQERMPDLPGMTDRQLKDVVEEAAGIKLLDRALELAKESRDKINQILTRQSVELSAHEVAKKKAIGQLERMKDLTVSWDEKQRGNIKEAQEKVRGYEAELALLKENDYHLPEIKRGLEIALKQLSTYKPPNREEIDRLQHALDDADRDRDEYRDVLRNLSARQRHYQSAHCPECGQAVKSEEADAKLAKIASEIAQAESDLAGTVSLRNALMDALRKAKEDFERESKSAGDYEKLTGAVERLRNAEDRANRWRRNVDFCEKNMSQQKRELAKLLAEKNPYHLLTEEAEKEYEKTALLVQDDEALVSKLKRDLDEAKAVCVIFGNKGVRGMVLDQVVPILNEQTGKYLAALTDGNITATWHTLKDNGKGEMSESFHIAVNNIYGADNFAGISGGERRKVRIACALALQDLVMMRASNPISLFIADEVDDALDTAGLERLMGILDEKARSTDTVLVISHNDIGDWISNHIVVRKKDGIATVEET